MLNTVKQVQDKIFVTQMIMILITLLIIPIFFAIARCANVGNGEE